MLAGAAVVVAAGVTAALALAGTSGAGGSADPGTGGPGPRVASRSGALALATTGGLRVMVAETSSWGDGYVAQVTVLDRGPAVHRWQVRFDVPAGTRITGAWNGELTEQGTHDVLTNASWDGTITRGASADAGFTASAAGAAALPRHCQVEGGVCTVSPARARPSNAAAGAAGAGLPAPGHGAAPLKPASTGAALAFAPYVDATVDTPPFDLVKDQRSSGTRFFTLAFVVSKDGCHASWGGYDAVSSGYYAGQIRQLRRAGGDVVVSFGGEAGLELAGACATVDQLAAQYRSVVHQYGLRYLDFDIEGAAEGDVASLDRRFAAIRELERADKRLSVSLTLPVLPTGLDHNGLAVVRRAIADGVRVDLVNIMTMDYGDGAAPHPAGMMGRYAIRAAEATHLQLEHLYPKLSPAAVWRLVGVTPLLGVNDLSDEVFRLADARQVLAFAEQVHLGRISMWAATRDVGCPGGPVDSYSDTCSGLAQGTLAFSKVLAVYRA